jgi:hypothetical protein
VCHEKNAVDRWRRTHRRDRRRLFRRPRPAGEHLAAERIDGRLAGNQSGRRQVVVAVRERGGCILAQVFPAEAGSVVHADESPAWNTLHASFATQRINHQDGYSIDGACTNGVESYFSRLRRGELGRHHHIAGAVSCSLRSKSSLA